jgi:hypothetical protein
MAFFAFLKAIAVLAFVAMGGLKMLQWVLIAVIALVALIVLRRGRRSPVALLFGGILLAAAIAVWTVHLPGKSDFYGEPGEYATMRQREQAREACEAEYTTLPDRYPVASLVDEANGLEEKSVFRLLVDRQLDFIEIRLIANARDVKVTSYRSLSNQLPKPAQAADAIRYVRLALAPEGTQDCLPLAAMTPPMREYLGVWPLPSGLCLQLRHATEASAAYSLAYVLEPQPERPVWGHYRIAERASGRVVAQLTSADGNEGPIHGSISDFNPVFQRPDCRTPHAALADRLIGPRGLRAVQQAAAN